MVDLKRLPASFFQSASGREPVREWLQGLTSDDRKIVGVDIAKAEFGWPIGMPTCRNLGDGLWEIRSDLSGGRIVRTLFCVFAGHMALLHGFERRLRKRRKTRSHWRANE
jgi:phage-related protein